MKRAQKVWKEHLGKLQSAVRFVDGVLGDGNGVVAVEGETNLCYVRVNGAPIIAYNDRTAYYDNLPVIVGYDPIQPNLLQVLDIRIRRGVTLPGNTRIGPHHERHEWKNVNGGDDVVYLDIRAFLPWRVTIATGLAIYIYNAILLTEAGWRNVSQTAALDLSSLKPTAGARYVLVSVSKADGSIVLTVGDVVGSTMMLSVDKIPEPESGTIPIAAVRLYDTQTELSEAGTYTDILDLRYPLWQDYGIEDLREMGAERLVGNSGSAAARPGEVPVAAPLEFSSGSLGINTSGSSFVKLGDDVQKVAEVSSAGSSGSAARSDHVHGEEVLPPLMWSDGALGIDTSGSSFVKLGDDVQKVAEVSSAGSSGSAARSDHVHGEEVLPPLRWSDGALGIDTSGSSFAPMLGDNVQDVASGSAAGTSGSAAREDHVHRMPVLEPLTWSGSALGLDESLLGVSREITLEKPGITEVTRFPATSDGFDDATDAATAGDTITIPAGVIDGDHTCKEGVTYIGTSRSNTIFSGQITGAAEVSLQSLSVRRSVNSASTVYGIQMAVDGYLSLLDVFVEIENAGAGEVRCVAGESTGSNVQIRNSYISVLSGTGYELYRVSTAVIGARFCFFTSATPMNTESGISIYACQFHSSATALGTPGKGDRAAVFTDLQDAPGSYSGQGGKVVAVKGDESGVEFVSGGAGGGTVTSVGLTMPGQFGVTGSPVTSSGTLAAAWNNQVANRVLAGPASGVDAAPDFRALVDADVPKTLTGMKINGVTLAAGSDYTLTVPASGSAAISTGIAGGQNIYGGTGAGENIVISSTSNVTKGIIYLGQYVNIKASGDLNIVGGASLKISTGDLHIGEAPSGFEAYPLTIYDSLGGMALKRTSTNESFILLFNDTANSGGQIRCLNAGGVRITDYSSSVEWLRIDANGNVGIGVTSISARLELKSDGTNPIQQWQNSAGTVVASINKDGKLGLGTTSSSNDLSMGGAVARKIALEANTVADGAGQDFTLQAGDATSGATNKEGGTLVLRAGRGTGSGTGDVKIYGYKTNATATAYGTEQLMIHIDGNKMSFFGGGTISKPAAYTQTYSTNSRTLPAQTSADLATTAATQTTPWGFASQAQAENIATQFNKLRTDLDNTKKVLNQVIDDLQSYGLLQ